MATKKKRLTSARDFSNASRASEDYCKPHSYHEFIGELNEACNKGDRDSKAAIRRLAPVMASSLEAADEFEHPKLAVEHTYKPNADKIVQQLPSVSDTMPASLTS